MSETRGVREFEGNMQALIAQGDELSSEIPEIAALAGALSKDERIKERARKAGRQLAKSQDIAREGMRKIRLAEETLASQDSGAAAEKLMESIDALMAALPKTVESANRMAMTAKEEIEEVLGEYDYIRMLLGRGGRATRDQLDILAFPRDANAKTNVLKVNGEAGSGKTLCLLAKLLRDVQADQGVLAEEYAKTALFVCFNKPLKKSIEKLLEGAQGDFPFAKERIKVVSFDGYINKLVKPSNGKLVLPRYERLWQIHYETKETAFEFTRSAMAKVAGRHSEKRREYYLDSNSADSAEWVADEIAWLAGKYGQPKNAQDYAGMCSRTGRGGKRRPSRDARAIILEIWDEYNKVLEGKRKYTISQAVYRLLGNPDNLPRFDSIAVDECQDLPVASIRLLAKMRKSNASRMYISGDEGQKIYKRDFNWTDLEEEGVKGTTKTLKGNHRNSKAIASFANRLNGGPKDEIGPRAGVYVDRWSDEALLIIVKKATEAGETCAIIGGYELAQKAKASGCKVETFTCLRPKGLEFDNVIVDYPKSYADTMEEEKRLRYVHFSRARKRLYVRIQNDAPPLMAEYYDEFL